MSGREKDRELTLPDVRSTNFIIEGDPPNMLYWGMVAVQIIFDHLAFYCSRLHFRHHFEV